MTDTLFQNYLSGMISGVNAILISHPIDTIKTNIQEKKPIDFKFRSLYRGLMAPLLGVGLEKAIVFGTYETSKKYTSEHNKTIFIKFDYEGNNNIPTKIYSIYYI